MASIQLASVYSSAVVDLPQGDCPVASSTCALADIDEHRLCSCELTFTQGCAAPTGTELRCRDTWSLPVVEALPAIVRPGRALVPMSSSARPLLVLSLALANGTWHVPAGRSYDGRPWEALHSPDAAAELRLGFACAWRRHCAVKLPALTDPGGYWLIEALEPIELPAARAERSAARFLMQATLGPTASSIGNLSSALVSGCAAVDGAGVGAAAVGAHTLCDTSTFGAWLTEQMGLAPTLHRAYWRRRANPTLRVPVPTGGCYRAAEPEPEPEPEPKSTAEPELKQGVAESSGGGSACGASSSSSLQLLDNDLHSPHGTLPHPPHQSEP